MIHGEKRPEHVHEIQAEGIRQVKLIDAAPIGTNVRSTVATYANVHVSCERSLREHRTRNVLGIRPGISPTIRENSAALDVTEQA